MTENVLSPGSRHDSPEKIRETAYVAGRVVERVVHEIAEIKFRLKTTRQVLELFDVPSLVVIVPRTNVDQNENVLTPRAV